MLNQVISILNSNTIVIRDMHPTKGKLIPSMPSEEVNKSTGKPYGKPFDATKYAMVSLGKGFSFFPVSRSKLSKVDVSGLQKSALLSGKTITLSF